MKRITLTSLSSIFLTIVLNAQIDLKTQLEPLSKFESLNSIQIQENLPHQKQSEFLVKSLSNIPAQTTATSVQMLDSTVKKDNNSNLTKSAYEYDGNGRKNLSVNFTWNKTANAWIPTNKTIQNWTNDGKMYTLYETLTYDTSTNTWKTTLRNESNWGLDNDGNWTLIEVDYSLNTQTNELLPTNKHEALFQGKTYTYKSFTDYIWDASLKVWNPSARYEVLFNDDGCEHTMANFTWNSTLNTWAGTKQGYIYDANNNLIQIVSYTGWNETNKTWGTKTISDVVETCNASSSEATYSFTNGVWTPVTKTGYDGDYKVYYDVTNGEFIKSYKDYSEKDGIGNETRYIRYDWDSENNKWYLSLQRDQSWDYNGQLLYKSEISNDKYGNQLYKIQLYRDDAQSAWRDGYSYKQEYIYDDKNQLKTYSVYKYNGEFVNYSKREIIRNDEENILFDINYSWSNNSWVETSRTTYYYSLHTTDVQTISSLNSFQLLPNPAKQSIYIKSEIEIKQVNIYSLQGKQLQSISSYKSNDNIDVSALQVGVYLVKITDTDGKSYTGKFVKE